MEVTKQFTYDSEHDSHTSQVRLIKDIFAMMDTAICGVTAFLIISRGLPDMYCSYSIVKGVRTALESTRLANDANASTAAQSGKLQGEAPPHHIHAAPVHTRGISGTL
jgi:hypothetical protein